MNSLCAKDQALEQKLRHFRRFAGVEIDVFERFDIFE